MKKFTKILMLLSMASLVTLTGCTKEDDPDVAAGKVTITAKMSDSTVIANGFQNVPQHSSVTLMIVSEGNDKNKLKSLSVTAGNQPLITNRDLSGTSSVDYVVVPNPNLGDVTVSISLTTASKTDPVVQTFTYKVVDGSTAPTYQTSGDVPFLGNQTDAEPKFWSAKRAERFTLAQAVGNTALQVDIDLAYCTRASGGNKIIAPGSPDAEAIYGDQWSKADEKITNWGANRNSTTFIKVSNITTATFNNANLDTDSLITVAKNAGEPNNTAVSVADKDIYLFKTKRGFYGLFSVNNPGGSYNPSTSSADPGNVTLIVRYQKEL